MGFASRRKRRRLEVKGLHKEKIPARIPPMMIPCDECGDMTQACQIEVISYIQLHVGQMGTVEEEYICKDCANEREYWRTQYGLDGKGQPGI